jgi:hypothetical protein
MPKAWEPAFPQLGIYEDHSPRTPYRGKLARYNCWVFAAGEDHRIQILAVSIIGPLELRVLIRFLLLSRRMVPAVTNFAVMESCVQRRRRS